MNRRHYQLFAVSILIGAPLLVSVASNAIPGLRGAAATVAEPSDAPPSAPEGPEGPPNDPMAALPKPLLPPEEATAQNGPQANGNFDAAPSLDPVGIDPSIAIGGNPAASAPSLKLPNDDAGRVTEDRAGERRITEMAQQPAAQPN